MPAFWFSGSGFFKFPRHREIAQLSEAIFLAIQPSYIAQSKEPSYWIYQIVMVLRDGNKVVLSESVSHDADELLKLLSTLSKAVGVPVRHFPRQKSGF